MMRWNSTKTYTEDDIIKMQQDAVNRVHDFQIRAQDVSYYDVPTIGEYHEPARKAAPESPPRVIEAKSHVVPSPAQIDPPEDPISGLLESLNLDGETLLILGLMFLLYNEKADSVLLVALAYLLL